jgi:hypothetical protein
LSAEVLTEDLDFLADLEVLVMFALFEKARDIGDDRAARELLDLEVVIFAMKVCG